MNKLPAKLFLSVLPGVDLVVPCNVFVQGSQEYHGDHPREEENYDQRVEDGEPLNVCVWHALQDVVPPAAPLHIVLYIEGDSVAVGDGGIHRSFTLDGKCRLQGFRVAVLIVVVSDGSRRDLHRHYSASSFRGTEILAPILAVAVVIVDHDVDVVENVIVIGGAVVSRDHTSVLRVAFLVHIAAHGEAGGAVPLSIFNWVTPGDRHVVNDPVVLVVHEHALLQQSQLLLVLWLGGLVLLGAKNLALVGVLSKGYLIRGRSDSLSKHHLPKVLMRRLALICFTKIEVVVLVGDHRLLAVKSVHEQFDVVGTCGRLLGRTIGDRCQARQVEGSGR